MAILVACWLPVACDSRTGTAEPVTAAEPARRIISLSPHLTELVYSAGAGERLVGVVEYSDYPPAASSLPRVGDSFRLDFEAIVGLAPDLILAWRSGTPADVRDRLRVMGFRVVSLDASGLDDIGQQIRDIGELAGTSAIARAAADAYSQRLGRLRAQYRDADIVDVFYQVSAQPLFTISGRHVISEAMAVCKGRNVFEDIQGLSPAVSLEAVIVAEPDAIVAGHDALTSDGLAAQWAAWKSIPAVRSGSLFTIDADWMTRPTTRILDAIQVLCTHLDRARAGSADLS
ncbi:MAG: cobalamin-binding protein [Gammaproteobacteria bacterium]